MNTSGRGPGKLPDPVQGSLWNVTVLFFKVHGVIPFIKKVIMFIVEKLGSIERKGKSGLPAAPVSLLVFCFSVFVSAWFLKVSHGLHSYFCVICMSCCFSQ